MLDEKTHLHDEWLVEDLVSEGSVQSDGPSLHEALAFINWSSQAESALPGTRLVYNELGSYLGAFTVQETWVLVQERHAWTKS